MQKQELDITGRDEAGDIVVEELVYALQIPGDVEAHQLPFGDETQLRQVVCGHSSVKGLYDSHLSVRPLHLLNNVQAAVQDELVQVPRLLAEPGLAILALLRGAKLVLEQRIVLGAYNGKIIGHCRLLFDQGRIFGAAGLARIMRPLQNRAIDRNDGHGIGGVTASFLIWPH
jgi:hypothetical protein